MTTEQIKTNILREKYSSRGGGVEIDLTYFGYNNEKMTAYQNYLGGGMLGGIANDCTIKDWQSDMKLTDLAFELKIYYARVNGLDMEYVMGDLPKSAY